MVYTAEMLEILIARGVRWLEEQSAAFRPAAQPLSPVARDKLSGFFGPELLIRARLARTARIENPEFLGAFVEPGEPLPMDFSRASGITFIDTVVFSNDGWPPSDPLLFHELVHVAQYELLGVREFVRRYVRGWADNGFRYETIPLEAHAYELQGAFESSPRTPFSVEEAVARRLGAGRTIADPSLGPASAHRPAGRGAPAPPDPPEPRGPEG